MRAVSTESAWATNSATRAMIHLSDSYGVPSISERSSSALGRGRVRMSKSNSSRTYPSSTFFFVGDMLAEHCCNKSKSLLNNHKIDVRHLAVHLPVVVLLEIPFSPRFSLLPFAARHRPALNPFLQPPPEYFCPTQRNQGPLELAS